MDILDEIKNFTKNEKEHEETEVTNINQLLAQIENETGTVIVERDGKQLGDELDEETKKAGVSEQDLENVETKKLEEKVELAKLAKIDYESKDQLAPLFNFVLAAFEKYKFYDQDIKRAIYSTFNNSDGEALKMIAQDIPTWKAEYEEKTKKIEEQKIENVSTAQKIKAMNIALNQEYSLTAWKWYKEVFDLTIENYNIYGTVLTPQGRKMCNNDIELIQQLQYMKPTRETVKILEEKIKQEQEQAKQPQPKQPDLTVEAQPKKSWLQRLKEKRQNRKNRI